MIHLVATILAVAIVVAAVAIDYIIKDLTTVEEGEGVIYHGCNCSGGFGSGVAGAIRKKWPSAYEAFKENGVGEDLLGQVNLLLYSDQPVIANAYTQLMYGPGDKRYADPSAIEKTMMQVAEYCDAAETDLFMPKVGCGLGGLSWEDEVKPIVEKVSSEFPNLNIHICDI